MGPHPYPWMVRELQRVVGDEARRAVPGAARRAPTPTGWWPASAAGRTRRGPSPGSSTPPPCWSGWRRPAGRRSATGVPGVVHGMKSYLLQDEVGQIAEAHSISAGLDYPGIGPEHAHLAADRAGPLRAGRRRRGAGRLPAAVGDRGHHPGPRAGPRPGLGGARGGPGDARRGAPCSSPCRGGATRTWPRSASCCDDGDAGGPAAARRAHGTARGAPAGPARRGAQAARALRDRGHGRRTGSRRSTPWPTPAPTPSRSASRSPTP